MNKLMTDEELHDYITELRRQRGLHLMDESDYTQKVIDLINSQKQAHANMVVGESEFPNPDKGFKYYTTRNDLRAEQRQRNSHAKP